MRAVIVWAGLAGLTSATAPNRQYTLVESYNHTNFFDKFNFFESNYSTGNYNDVDPTSGYINYRNRDDAMKLGLIATQGSEMFLGVNHRDILDPKGKGRDSVRIESKQLYNYGLFIAEFTHLPKVTCGVWPAFWTFGDPWPVKGEMDIYENWNLAKDNAMTLHTGDSKEVGNCTICQENMVNPVVTTNCDVTFQDEHQSPNQACQTLEQGGQWGSQSGGVYAMEWTSGFVRLWSWSREETPADVKCRQPKPQLWGKPLFWAGGSSCDMDSHLRDQKLVLNIDFCGVAAGNPTLWGQQCRNATGYENCADYVAKHPDDFADAFWKVRAIDIYQAASNCTHSLAALRSSRLRRA
ncbi:endo-1,3(4)-beta-glucanase, putative [Cordyceps militaris CM01]|uniref:Endo-1,3(4)-beta-glucanase, putative n=1 Tax=Cordyceps militaris (strain CM01) TaxID=983644 RepID=G3J5A1_CORMM|nr:endo-1,3(4)-beta-glucanase, putative [Cordyceps militaris CM01]EGX96811.1 endo-1,3(4)-beta-glucanase, putative [Cordyceps militaris CM01]